MNAQTYRVRNVSSGEIISDETNDQDVANSWAAESESHETQPEVEVEVLLYGEWTPLDNQSRAIISRQGECVTRYSIRVVRPRRYIDEPVPLEIVQIEIPFCDLGTREYSEGTFRTAAQGDFDRSFGTLAEAEAAMADRISAR